MRIIHFFTLPLLLALFAVAPCRASEPKAETSSPTQALNADLLVVQYVDLEFKLPRSMVGRVVVLGTGSPNLAILRHQDSSADSFVLGSVDDFWEIYEQFDRKGFFKGLDIHDAESFFDSLAVTPGTPVSAPLKMMREAFSVEGAEYTKSAKGTFTVYFVHTKRPGERIVYILIDGERRVYQIAGDISDADYEALLSGMALSSVH